MGKSNASVQAHGGSASNICHFSFWKIRGYIGSTTYKIYLVHTTCFEKGAGGGMMGLGRGGRRWMRKQEGHSKWPKPPAGSTMFWSAPHFINICAKASATVGGCATIQRSVGLLCSMALFVYANDCSLDTTVDEIKRTTIYIHAL